MLQTQSPARAVKAVLRQDRASGEDYDRVRAAISYLSENFKIVIIKIVGPQLIIIVDIIDYIVFNHEGFGFSALFV